MTCKTQNTQELTTRKRIYGREKNWQVKYTDKQEQVVTRCVTSRSRKDVTRQLPTGVVVRSIVLESRLDKIRNTHV